MSSNSKKRRVSTFFDGPPGALSQSVSKAALTYARHGLLPVPLWGVIESNGTRVCECKKGPACGSPGKHPRKGGWQRDSADTTELATYLEVRKHSNLGIAMGGKRRLIAIDIDGLAGEESLAVWEGQHGPLPRTLTSRSGREDGGRHLIFALPVERDIGQIKNTVKVAPGIDVRGEGSQIVVSPSLHATGKRYQWIELATPAPLPDWLWEKLSAAKTPRVATDAAGDFPPEAQAIPMQERIARATSYVERLPPSISERNGHKVAFRAALACTRGFCLPEEESLAVLQAAFNPRCVPVWSTEELHHKVESAAAKGARPFGYLLGLRMTIDVDDDQHRIIENAVNALASDENIFQRAGALVRVLKEETPLGSASHIAPFTAAALREPLSRNAKFVRQSRRMEIPGWLPGAVLQRRYWPVRTIRRVVDVPVLRAGGSIVNTVGLDEQTGFYLDPSIRVPTVSPGPSRAEARKACKVLREVWSDFPFASGEHEAATLAALLTPFARGVFLGPSPLIAIDGTTRGIGKGLLVDSISTIAFGTPAARMAQAENDPEQRKAITAIAAAAKPLVLIDNVVQPLGGAALDAALTSVLWEDRMLHTNSIVRAPLDALWFATGNNILFRGDTARRVLHVRLTAQEERPEERQGFRHPDLLIWIRKNRPQLVWAALTILSSYLSAGCPVQEMIPWGSFDDWSRIVRGAVIWCGLPDPAMTRAKLMEDSDREPSLVKSMFSVMRKLQKDSPRGVLAKQLVTLSPSNSDWPSRERCEEIDALLHELVPTSSSLPVDARRLGKKFESLRERVFGKWKLIRVEGTNAGARWRVVEATPPTLSEKEEDKRSRGSVANNMKIRRWVLPPSTISGGSKRK